MVFEEKKTDTGYQYHCSDIFGDVTLLSINQLDKTALDLVTMKILELEKQDGVLQLENIQITYEYKSRNNWERDEEGNIIDRTVNAVSE